MGVMKLNGLTFSRDPKLEGCPDIPRRNCSSVDTFGGVAFFSWGTEYSGQKIIASWDFLPTLDFNNIIATIIADQATQFFDGIAYFDVQVLSFTSSYIEDMPASRDIAVGRKDGKLEMLIILNPVI